MVDLYPAMLKITPKSVYETMKKVGTKLEWCSGLLYAKNLVTAVERCLLTGGSMVVVIRVHRWARFLVLSAAVVVLRVHVYTIKNCIRLSKNCWLTGGEVKRNLSGLLNVNRIGQYNWVNIIEWHAIQCSDYNRPYLLSVPYITLEKLHSVVWRR